MHGCSVCAYVYTYMSERDIIYASYQKRKNKKNNAEMI